VESTTIAHIQSTTFDLFFVFFLFIKKVMNVINNFL
jgi:hypothetical protein